MLTGSEYIRQSIEINLFFLRIMKEHLIHVVNAFILREPNMVQFLINLKDKYEELLTNTILLANGVVKSPSLAAGDIITQYTYEAELATQFYVGRPINTEITRMEAALVNSTYYVPNPMIEQSVNKLNQQIILLLKDGIQAQKVIVASVQSCKMFFMTYPMLLNHITHEAEHYLIQLQALQRRQSPVNEPKRAAMNVIFWNYKMAEHARIGQGLLDPTEKVLIQKANGFAVEFEELTKAAREANGRLELLPEVTRRSIEATTNIRNFKEQLTIGILECKIRSMMLPLLVEHVLREANYFLKELRAIDLNLVYPRK
jgi:hypothetical protein